VDRLPHGQSDDREEFESAHFDRANPHYPRIHLGWSDLRSLADDEFHFIDAPRPELYASSDPAEKANVIDDNRRVAAAMRKELEPFSRELPQAGNIDPEEAKKLAALGYLSSTANPTGPLPDPKERIGDLNLLRDAARLDGQRRYADAANVLRGVIERNPLLTDAWTMLGRVYEKAGRLEDAERTYKRGIQVAPAIAGEFSLSLANVYLMMNKPDEASRHAEIALKTNSGSAHILMGRAALAKKDLRAAAEHAGAARQSFSYEPAALVLLAQIQTQAGQLPQALETIRNAAAHAQKNGIPAPALLHFVTGDVLARMNRYPEAIAEFTEEIRLFPNDRHAYASLAVVYMLTGRPADANATMERLVAANPGRSSYELAAKTFAELGDQTTAAAWRRRVPQ
jgi:tetratricopeptide (TPR) repeat protein